MLLGNPRNTGHGDLGLHLRLTKQSTFWGSIWGGWQGQFWVKKADKDWRLSNRPGHSYSPDSGVWCQCIGEVERTQDWVWEISWRRETFSSTLSDLWASLVAQTVKRLPTVRETWVQSLGWEDLLEKETATHSSTLAGGFEIKLLKPVELNKVIYFKCILRASQNERKTPQRWADPEVNTKDNTSVEKRRDREGLWASRCGAWWGGRHTGKLMEGDGHFRKVCDVDSSPCHPWTNESLESSPVMKTHLALPGAGGEGDTFTWEIYARLLGNQGEGRELFLQSIASQLHSAQSNLYVKAAYLGRHSLCPFSFL